MHSAGKPWWQQATALVSLGAGGAITGFAFAPGAAADVTSPTSMPVQLMALEKATQPAPADDAMLRTAIVNVTNYYLKMAQTKSPAEMEAIIWQRDSLDGVDHGESCAAFASMTLELAAQVVGQQSWVTGGTTYPWPLHKWADVRVDPNPSSLGITSILQDAEANNRWHALGDGYQPQPGDWVLFDGHVEVVTKYSHGTLYTVGGDSLPNFSVNAHEYSGPLSAQGVAGFVDNGLLSSTTSNAAAAGGQASNASAGQSQASGRGGGNAPSAGQANASASDGAQGQAGGAQADIPGTGSPVAQALTSHTSGAAIPGMPASGSGSGSGSGHAGQSPSDGEASQSEDGSGSPGASRTTDTSHDVPSTSAVIPGLAAPAQSPSGGSRTTPYQRHQPSAATTPTKAADPQQAFIDQVAPGAMAAQQKYGIPAAVTIAQAIDESAWGQSTLATQDHNLFGIKGSGPAGSDIQPTQEYLNGQWVTQSAAFSVYHNVAESIEAHSQLLASSRYYTKAMSQSGSPNNFANDLTGVYATNPDYGSNLINLMRQYNLYRYDAGTNGTTGTADQTGTPNATAQGATPGGTTHAATPSTTPRATAAAPSGRAKSSASPSPTGSASTGSGTAGSASTGSASTGSGTAGSGTAGSGSTGTGTAGSGTAGSGSTGSPGPQPTVTPTVTPSTPAPAVPGTSNPAASPGTPAPSVSQHATAPAVTRPTASPGTTNPATVPHGTAPHVTTPADPAHQTPAATPTTANPAGPAQARTPQTSGPQTGTASGSTHTGPGVTAPAAPQVNSPAHAHSAPSPAATGASGSGANGTGASGTGPGGDPGGATSSGTPGGASIPGVPGGGATQAEGTAFVKPPADAAPVEAELTAAYRPMTEASQPGPPAAKPDRPAKPASRPEAPPKPAGKPKRASAKQAAGAASPKTTPKGSPKARRKAPRKEHTTTTRYQEHFPQAVRSAFVTTARTPLMRAEPLYRDVADETGIPWEVLAACHWMQCEARPGYSPVRGEKLGTLNPDGTVYHTPSEALAQCARDLSDLSDAVYGIDLAGAVDLSVRDLAKVFAAFRWGALLEVHQTSAMEFPYSVAGLTAQHTGMRWPKIDDPRTPDKPGSRFRRPFGAVPIVLGLKYPATVLVIFLSHPRNASKEGGPSVPVPGLCAGHARHAAAQPARGRLVRGRPAARAAAGERPGHGAPAAGPRRLRAAGD